MTRRWVLPVTGGAAFMIAAVTLADILFPNLGLAVLARFVFQFLLCALMISYTAVRFFRHLDAAVEYGADKGQQRELCYLGLLLYFQLFAFAPQILSGR